LEEYRRAAPLAKKPVKVSLIGPDRIMQRYDHAGSKAVYASVDAFIEDVVAIQRRMISELVAAGCRYVHIDEPGYTAYVEVPELEPLDTLVRRIEEATKYVPLERLAISPQCGFGSDVVGNLISEEDQKRKLERVVEAARRVWQ